MVDFKSIIVFDSETSSMPSLDHNTTRIVEMAFLGCEIQHLEESRTLPRVLHKLVLSFKPNKMIHPHASQVSGLNNELLNNLGPFSVDDATILKNFISRLPQPVCIVAHNGNKFDFPILKRELQKLNFSLPNNVYCADSLAAFKYIYNESGSAVKDSENNKGEIEKTPKFQKTQSFNSLNYKSNDAEKNNMIARPGVNRKLFPESPKSLIDDPLRLQSNTPNSFRLKDIYFFFHGKYFPDAHYAEEDAKALLSCIVKCHEFVNWLSKNSIIFNSIEALF